MNVKKMIAGSLLLAFSLSWSGCANMYSAKYQKVRLTSATPGATISYMGDSLGTGSVSHKVNKWRVFQSVEVAKKGFVTGSYAFEVTHKLSPTAAFVVLDGIALLAAPAVVILDLKTPKVHKFNPRQVIPELVELRPRQSDEKYLLVDNTSFDAASKDVRALYYKRLSHYRKKDKDVSRAEKKSKKVAKDNIKITNTIFTDELNGTLRDIGFIDTSRHIFTNADNTLFLDASIHKVIFREFQRPITMGPALERNDLISVQLEIEWKVLDYYKQVIYTTKTVKISDMYMVLHGTKDSKGDRKDVPEDHLGFDVPLKKAIANNFQLSLADVRTEISKKGLLKIGNKGQDTSAIVTITRPTAPGEAVRLNEMLKSSVSIKVDEGHGSGVIVSEDGYIVTNYHVVAGSKNIEVIFNDDTKISAKVIKFNSTADLALIKVEKSGLKALPLSDTKEPEIGIDVWAIGTPNNLDLGQTLSKGIISGIRKANDMSYIQTDVKISPGNSGGALINRKGEVYGIVSSKLIGFGTEGVGFAISAYQIFEKLKLQYK
jgi:serine protease Do